LPNNSLSLSLSLSLSSVIIPSLSLFQNIYTTIIVSKGSHCTKRKYCTRGNPNSSSIPEGALSFSLSSRCKYYLILFLL
ncbi:hypothetical protein GIB67_019423, partial [Kingdonia uniflora]